VKKIEVFMEVMMLPIMEVTIIRGITCKKMDSFKVTLQLDTIATTYQTWNRICNMGVIPKTNNKISSYALGDGHVTIVTWLLLLVTTRLVLMKKIVHAGTINDMVVIHTHLGVLFLYRVIDLSSNFRLLKPLLKAVKQLRHRETWDLYSILVKN